MIWKPFKRFPLLLTLPINRLKPGVNENLNPPSCAQQRDFDSA